MDQGQLITVPTALERLPISREAFYRALKKGHFPQYKFGRKIMVRLDEVIEAMRRPAHGAGE